MLMVVFGAGASYDSVPAYPPRVSPGTPSIGEVPGWSDRLPLANQL
jgi:hypothetical protein